MEVGTIQLLVYYITVKNIRMQVMTHLGLFPWLSPSIHYLILFSQVFVQWIAYR